MWHFLLLVYKIYTILQLISDDGGGGGSAGI